MICTAIFVDNMRLLYVVSGLGQAANQGNEERYLEFVRMCEQHLADLDTQVQRFHALLDINFLRNDLREVELGLRHLLAQLRHGLDMKVRVLRFIPIAAQIARRILAACERHDVEGLASARILVDRIGRTLATDDKGALVAGNWEAFRLRLDMQTEFLKQCQQHSEMRIFTIADDYAMGYALAYFLIDAWLLDAGARN
ncbi:hypothetical protein [Polaromonas glacialis]|uniref:hypothetical protein n=1 Tax=Polaromonas glacialis TaxID=866564 RepID=UPI0012EB9187|nr:hypothetical protein [Polaromonas glacialis]